MPAKSLSIRVAGIDIRVRCRIHWVLLPNKSLCECHMTLDLYIADLQDQWDLLNLRHKSSVKELVPQHEFTNFEGKFPARQEGDVREVC